jgi:hypothetical protein
MMDNYLFDHIMPLVKPNAWKILCLIIRKTRGWHKTADQISFSQIKAGTGISSDETVSNALKQLVEGNYILAKKGGQWDATEYAINTGFSTTIIEVEEGITTEIEAESTTKNEVGSTTIIEDTKETSLKKRNKASSAEADHGSPVSLLSEKEVKALKLPLSQWQQYLKGEQAERGRIGVLEFLERKVAIGLLLPINADELALFEILAVEYKADGGKSPPSKFPSLETKRLFNEAAQFHNGALESVIRKAIHKRGKGIAKIVDYISSPTWRKDNSNGRTRAEGPRRGQQGANENAKGGFQPGNGRTPEMQAALERAFAPKPG